MTKYGQKPAGWWQDNKGRMQPPGSSAARTRAKAMGTCTSTAISTSARRKRSCVPRRGFVWLRETSRRTILIRRAAARC